MHSALKKDGKALYEYARAGIAVEREARQVVIHALKLELIQTEKAQAAIKMIVTCSKGTYIRTLGEDIGAALGVGAHLTFLRRIDTGGLGVERCVTLAQLEAMDEAQRLACVLPPESLLVGHTPCHVGRRRCGSGSVGVCVAVDPGLTPVPWRSLAINLQRCWGWATSFAGSWCRAGS